VFDSILDVPGTSIRPKRTSPGRAYWERENLEPIISKEEIPKAIKSMKNSKAPGFDEITTEDIKAADEPMVNMLEKYSEKLGLKRNHQKIASVC